MSRLVSYQPNTKRSTDDCLVRSIAAWLFKNNELDDAWSKAIIFTTRISLETGYFPANLEVAIIQYFKNHGCEIHNLTKKQSRKNIAEKMYMQNKNAFLLSKEHITFCNNKGSVFDSWDSMNKMVYCYIVLDNFSLEPVDK